MSELPADRLHDSPPFTYTGMDALGPFQVTDGSQNTSSTSSSRKAWAVLFTYLVSRAVHIEPLVSMDTTAFKNAPRWFFALRGVCKKFRCDQGTNFIRGHIQEATAIYPQDTESEASRHGREWQFYPPKASHHRGLWERNIQAIKRILYAIMLELGFRIISRDEFTTFIAEAAATINNTPLGEMYDYPNELLPITPQMLLTLREFAYGKRRWRRVQYLSDQFWTSWRRERSGAQKLDLYI